MNPPATPSIFIQQLDKIGDYTNKPRNCGSEEKNGRKLRPGRELLRSRNAVGDSR